MDRTQQAVPDSMLHLHPGPGNRGHALERAPSVLYSMENGFLSEKSVAERSVKHVFIYSTHLCTCYVMR